MGYSDHAEVTELLEQRFERLAPQLQKAARYLVEYPGDIALYSMRDIAKRAEIRPATLVRLATTLGFDSYVSLREVYQNSLRQSHTSVPFSGRARHLHRATGGGRTAELMAQIESTEIENLKNTFAANEESAIHKAVSLIESAQRVYVLGQRSCYPVAFFFNYVYGLFRPNSILLSSNGGTLVDDLRAIGPRDLLIAISIEPYTTTVVQAAQFARKERAKVLAITDSRVSPIRKSATESLLTANRSASFFHSILSPMALVHGLIAILAARGGEKVPLAIARSEEQLQWFNAYWPQAHQSNEDQ